MTFRFSVLLILSCFLATPAWAGRVFGDIKMADKPIGKGVPVMITTLLTDAEGKTKPAVTHVDSTGTDEFGAYKLVVKEPGKCLLTIVYEKQNVALEVFSNKEPTRYDLILEKKEGKLALRRK